MEIEGYENYLIYNDGRVYSKTKNKFMKSTLDKKKGYYIVSLYKNKKYKSFRIHRLVALHYLERVEGKDEVDHIDRDKTNNHVSNLRWCNHSENNINKGVHHNNKLGIKHIIKIGNIYKLQINRNGNRHVKYLKTLEEAIEYRDNYLSSEE